MKLVYLKEGRKYGVQELRNCIVSQLQSDDDNNQVPAVAEFFGDKTPHAEVEKFLDRFIESLNRIKTVAGDGKTVARKLSNGSYVFRYVGLYDFVDVGAGADSDKRTGLNLTFFFFPKFIDFNESTDCSGDSPDDDEEASSDKIGSEDENAWEKWKELIETFASSGHKERNAVLQAIDWHKRELNRLGDPAGETKQHEGLLELAVRVLRDYLENGVYTVQQRELEHNGQGEIDWDTTIDQYQPMFLKGRPYFMDYATELANSDEDHYITRLHQCLVTTWGRKLEELGLSSVLRVNVPLLSEEELCHFGSKEHQLDRIRKEMGLQFVTKSRNTLALMKELIEEMSESQSANDHSLSFGMNGAEHLWEAACAQVLGSELDKKIGDCNPSWTSNSTFREYMPKPIWKKLGSYNEDVDNKDYTSEKSGWKLDFIRTWPSNGPVEKLVILDAKYYDVSWRPPNEERKKIQGQPGIGDIAKQIFYQMAFEDLVKGSSIGFVNAFVFPEDDSVKPTARISEQVWLGWSGNPASAFSAVNLFAVRLPGIELLRRYANGETDDGKSDDSWFRKIVEGQPPPPSNPKEPTP